MQIYILSVRPLVNRWLHTPEMPHRIECNVASGVRIAEADWGTTYGNNRVGKCVRR